MAKKTSAVKRQVGDAYHMLSWTLLEAVSSAAADARRSANGSSEHHDRRFDNEGIGLFLRPTKLPHDQTSDERKATPESVALAVRGALRLSYADAKVAWRQLLIDIGSSALSIAAPLPPAAQRRINVMLGFDTDTRCVLDASTIESGGNEDEVDDAATPPSPKTVTALLDVIAASALCTSCSSTSSSGDHINHVVGATSDGDDDSFSSLTVAAHQILPRLSLRGSRADIVAAFVLACGRLGSMAVHRKQQLHQQHSEEASKKHTPRWFAARLWCAFVRPLASDVAAFRADSQRGLNAFLAAVLSHPDVASLADVRVGLHLVFDFAFSLYEVPPAAGPHHPSRQPTNTGLAVRDRTAVKRVLTALSATQFVDASHPRFVIDFILWVLRMRLDVVTEEGGQNALVAVPRAGGDGWVGDAFDHALTLWAATGDRAARRSLAFRSKLSNADNKEDDTSPSSFGGWDIASDFVQSASDERQWSLAYAVMAVLMAAPSRDAVDAFMAAHHRKKSAATLRSAEDDKKESASAVAWLGDLMSGVSLRLSAVRPEVQKSGALVAIRFATLMHEKIVSAGGASSSQQGADDDLELREFERQYPGLMSGYVATRFDFGNDCLAVKKASNRSVLAPPTLRHVSDDAGPSPSTTTLQRQQRDAVRFPHWRYPDDDAPLDADQEVPVACPAFVHNSRYGSVVEALGGRARWPERDPAASVAASNGAATKRSSINRHDGPLAPITDVSDERLPARDNYGVKKKAPRTLDDAVKSLSEGSDDAYEEREYALLALPKFLMSEAEAATAAALAAARGHHQLPSSAGDLLRLAVKSRYEEGAPASGGAVFGDRVGTLNAAYALQAAPMEAAATPCTWTVGCARLACSTPSLQRRQASAGRRRAGRLSTRLWSGRWPSWSSSTRRLHLHGRRWSCTRTSTASVSDGPCSAWRRAVSGWQTGDGYPPLRGRLEAEQQAPCLEPERCFGF
jgi:hypothetical protein